MSNNSSSNAAFISSKWFMSKLRAGLEARADNYGWDFWGKQGGKPRAAVTWAPRNIFGGGETFASSWEYRNAKNAPNVDYGSPAPQLRVTRTWVSLSSGQNNNNNNTGGGMPWEVSALRFSDDSELRWDMRLPPVQSARLLLPNGQLVPVDDAHWNVHVFTVPRKVQFEDGASLAVVGTLREVCEALSKTFLAQFSGALYGEYGSFAIYGAGLTSAQFETRWAKRGNWPGWCAIRPTYIYPGLYREFEAAVKHAPVVNIPAMLDGGAGGCPDMFGAWCGNRQVTFGDAKSMFWRYSYYSNNDNNDNNNNDNNNDNNDNNDNDDNNNDNNDNDNDNDNDNNDNRNRNRNRNRR